MVRLGLVSSIPKALKLALELAGAPDTIRDLYATWSLEIGPDFWTFCNSGIAQSASIKEILSLPPNHVFKVSTGDPHPPPYSRVLFLSNGAVSYGVTDSGMIGKENGYCSIHWII